jgi:YggT family protein
LSWINPYTPLAPFFDALSRPLLLPARRLLPPIGGIDLSPLVVLLLLQVVLIVLGNLQPVNLLLP